MNRNRAKLNKLRNGHTVYIADKSNGIVDQIRIKNVDRYQIDVIIYGTMSTLMNRGNAIDLDDYEGGLLLTPEGNGSDQIITFCRNKALRWAGYYVPEDPDESEKEYVVNLDEQLTVSVTTE
jgi:hypothetical protein